MGSVVLPRMARWDGASAKPGCREGATGSFSAFAKINHLAQL
jgi:hypothetical protein